MFKKLFTASVAICLLAFPLSYTAAAPLARAVPVDPVALPDGSLSSEQIDNLLAPIALYPDPLLAQVLPASTFVDQIDQAARYLRANNNKTTGVDDQKWDVSVKSIAHYPDVVFKMSQNLDWTAAIGQAYVQQSKDVLQSIQRLRNRAKEAGNLKTTPQQTVVVEKEVIKIVPAQPQYIYVPVYDPQVVYVQQSSGVSTGAVVATAAIAFTTGLLIGAWLNNDCDWYGYRVYYHGWTGGGWVGYSRGVVVVRNNYYVNNRYATVNVNRAVVNRNINYNNVNRYTNINRNINYNNVNINNVNRNNVNINNVNRNNVNLNNVNRNNVNNNNINRNISNTANLDNYRGQTSTKNRPTQNQVQPTGQQRNSAFSNSGNTMQTRSQSTRGQTSRMSTPTTTRTRPTTNRGGGRRRN